MEPLPIWADDWLFRAVVTLDYQTLPIRRDFHNPDAAKLWTKDVVRREGGHVTSIAIRRVPFSWLS